MQTTITLKVNPDEWLSEELTLVVNGNLSLAQAKSYLCSDLCTSGCQNNWCADISFDAQQQLDMDGVYPKLLGFNVLQEMGTPVDAQVQATITKLSVTATSDHLRIENHNGKAAIVFSNDGDTMYVHQVYFPYLANVSIDQVNQKLAPWRYNVLEVIESTTEIKVVLDTETFTEGVFTEQGVWSVCLIDPNNIQEVITLNALVPQGEIVPMNLSQDLYLNEILSIEWVITYECDWPQTQTSNYNFVTDQEY